MLTETSSTGQHPSVRQITGFLLLALSVLWCIYWFVHSRSYWEDDAYIHLEFARSLAAGHGFAFDGTVVDGDTAPLWVLLLAAMHSLLPDWLAAGKLLTILGAIFGIAGVYAFARRLGSSLLPARDADVFPAAIVLLVAVNPYTCYWIFSGMEPIAAAGLACWAILAATRPSPSAPVFLAGCFLAGIAPLLRPEMFLLAALLLLPLLDQWRSLRAPPFNRWFLFAAGLLLLAGPQLLWSLYSLHAFGHLLPNTVAAKRAAPGDSVVIRVVKVYLLGLPALLLGLPAALGCLLRLRKSRGRSLGSNAIPKASLPRRPSLSLAGWLFLLWTAITLLFYIVNHTYVQSRYALLTAPGLMTVVLALALFAYPRCGRALCGFALLWSVAMSVAVVRPFLRNKEINCRTSRDMALFIRDRIPAAAPVAVYSIGEIAFVSQHPIVDTGGITRPGAVPYLNAPPEAMLQWARSQGAQYDISGKAPEPGAVSVFTVDAPFVGWSPFQLAAYSTANTMSLWKLPASPDPPQQADRSLPAAP